MSTLRILLVEDDPLLALDFADVLADMGHVVCAFAETQAAAVTAATDMKPDLMIVDVNLIDGNGIAAVEEILRSGHVPHLFMSGDVSTVHSRRPAAVAIQKPFRVAELAKCIQRALVPLAPA